MSDYLEQVRRQLIRDEGIRLKAYRDSVGKLTIGVGRNLDDRGISQPEAMHLLDNDIAICIGELIARFPWFEKLDPARQAALLNMAFNLGISRLSKFTVTLAYMKLGDYDNAAVAVLQSKWAEQVGQRALRLADQIRTGEFQ